MFLTIGNHLRELTKEARDNETLKGLTAKNYIPEQTLNEMYTRMENTAKKGFSGIGYKIKDLLTETYKDKLDELRSTPRKTILAETQKLLELKFTGVSVCMRREKDGIDYVSLTW